MGHLSYFVADNDHLSVASVSRLWSNLLRRLSATTTPDQLRHSFACGLVRHASVCVAAARLNRLDLLQVAVDAGCPWDKEVCDLAAEGGNRGLMRWARTNGCPCSPRTMAAIAALTGLTRNLSPVALLEWGLGTGAPMDERTANNLACRGDLDAVMWAVEEGCPVNEETTAAAAGAGHLHVLEWLHSSGCPWGPTTCSQVCMYVRTRSFI